MTASFITIGGVGGSGSSGTKTSFKIKEILPGISSLTRAVLIWETNPSFSAFTP